MKTRLVALAIAVSFAAAAAPALRAEDDVRVLARDILKQLIEIDTTEAHGSTTPAARAMADRLKAVCYPLPHLGQKASAKTRRTPPRPGIKRLAVSVEDHFEQWRWTNKARRAPVSQVIVKSYRKKGNRVRSG